jgi:phenylacetate-CoA ligase
VELLLPDGCPAPPGEPGEVVATGFANHNQIFLRYRTGDLASWAQEPCPCGRNTLPTLQELIGRLEDTVVGPDGRETVRFHGLFVDLPGISEGQVVQEELHRFLINLVPSPMFTPKDEDTVRGRMQTRLGPEVRVDFARLDAIPREPNGKFRAVISRVQRKSGRPVLGEARD